MIKKKKYVCPLLGDECLVIKESPNENPTDFCILFQYESANWIKINKKSEHPSEIKRLVLENCTYIQNLLR